MNNILEQTTEHFTYTLVVPTQLMFRVRRNFDIYQPYEPYVIYRQIHDERIYQAFI